MGTQLYEIKAKDLEQYNNVIARLRGLGANVVTASLGKKRIVADISLPAAVQVVKDLGAEIVPTTVPS
jgi:hypothetical protein